jgi:hypothetical protein
MVCLLVIFQPVFSFDPLLPAQEILTIKIGIKLPFPGGTMKSFLTHEYQKILPVKAIIGIK